MQFVFNLFSDNKRLDEWVTQERLNLEKVQLPKVDDKKKSSATSAAASKSKLNPSKSKQNHQQQSQPQTPQPSESQPATPSSSSAVDGDAPISGASTPTLNKIKSTGSLLGRKRKATEEVYFHTLIYLYLNISSFWYFAYLL